MSAKQAINDKLQGCVATFLRYGGVVNNHIEKSLRVKKIKIGEYLATLQERGCLMHFAHLANTLLKDEESARDYQVLACKFAKYSPT